MGIINKKEISLQTLRLQGRRPEITKPGNLRFKIDRNLNRKTRSPDDRRERRSGSKRFRITVWKQRKNIKVGCYSEFSEPKATSRTEQSNNEPENVSSTEESDVVKTSATVPIVDSKDYDIAKKTIHYNQLNHINEKPKIKNAQVNESLKKAVFNFMVDLKTLLQKTSVDPKLLQLKV